MSTGAVRAQLRLGSRTQRSAIPPAQVSRAPFRLTHFSTMGYDLHITRRENWFDTNANISIEEWLAVVDSDPELRLDGFAEAQTPTGEKIRIDNDGLCVWTAYSRHGINGNMAWLWHSQGNIMAKNPDVEIRRKMWVIAEKLGARLQGDEGEWYGPDGEMLPQMEEQHSLPLRSRPWWRLW